MTAKQSHLFERFSFEQQNVLMRYRLLIHNGTVQKQGNGIGFNGNYKGTVSTGM